METTSPMTGGISSPKAQCMDASKEISQCYIDVPLAPSAIINNPFCYSSYLLKSVRFIIFHNHLHNIPDVLAFAGHIKCAI